MDPIPHPTREGGPAPPSLGAIAAVLAITLLALGLRLTHGRYLLPHQPESDASAVLQTEALLGYDLNSTNPHLGKYPLIIPYLASLLGRWPAQEVVERPLDEHLWLATIPIRRVRLVVSLLSVITVVGTWLVARNFMGASAAILACFVSGTSILCLTYSGQARPHAAAAPFVLLAVAAAIRLARTGRLRDFFLTAVTAALVVGTLQSGLAALLPCAVASLIHLRRQPGRTLVGLALGVVTVGLSLLATYAFLFAESQGVDPAQLEFKDGRLMQAGHALDFNWFRGKGFAVTARALFGYDPWLLLAPLGIAAWFANPKRKDPGRRDWSLVIVLAYVIPYALVIGLYDRSYARFSLPLMPFTGMLGAYGIEAAGRWFRTRSNAGRWWPNAATALLVGVFAVPPLASSLRLVWLRGRDDTGTRAANWIRENLDRNANIGVLPPIHLPLSVDSAFLDPIENTVETANSFQWLGYLTRVPRAVRPPGYALRYGLVRDAEALLALRDRPRKFIRQLECDWLVIDASADWRVTVLMRRVRDVVASSAELVARFGPIPSENGETRYSFHYDEIPEGAFWIGQLWRADCLGPVIEIYRWPASDS